MDYQQASYKNWWYSCYQRWPTKWKLGRIVQLHPGKDGTIRVVTVRLGSGLEIKRPNIKLCVLLTEPNYDPIENDYFQRRENVET